MNKTDLVNQIAQETGLTKKKSRAAVNAFFSSIISGLQRDQEVVIAGFCIFEVRERGEYLAVNPKTRECVYVPEKGVVKFIPGQKLLQAAYTSGKQENE